MNMIATWAWPLLLGAVASAAVTVEDGVRYEGQESFRIVTPSATYVYHKEGAALASLKDRDGVEWIGYRPDGRAAGEFRGIPNLGDFGHPGYSGEKGSVSRILERGPNRVSVVSEASDGRWGWRWDFLPDYARFTMLKTDRPYWFLYEGTPGGTLDLKNGYMVLSSGVKRPFSEHWAEDLPEPEWLYFAAGRRSFFLAKHEDDSALDQYWPMDGGMTVFGFGRKYRCCERYLKEAPATFTIGLVESVDFKAVSSAIAKALQQR